jgi:MFS family permease
MLGTAAPPDRRGGDTPPHTLPAGARALLAAALVAVLIAALDLTVITTILARIIFDLGINVGEIERYSWIVSGYLLAYLITIPIAGRVSDLIGRRPVFLFALGLFVVGSVWCTAAQGLVPLILARAVQGLGGGALVPVTLALAADLLPPGRRAAAIGAIGAIDTLGWVLGPLWGAGVVTLFGATRVGFVRDWRWVFALNVPIALAVLATIFIVWRRAARIERRAPGRFDWLGALTLTLALACLNLAVSSGAEGGGGGPRALGAAPNPLAPYRLLLLAGALVAFALFIVVVRRAPWPILPLGLFRRPVFGAANLANLLVGAALIVVMVDVPFVVALLATDANRAGLISALLLLPFTLAMAGGSLGGGAISERAGYRTVAIGGLVIAAVGFWRLWGWPDALAYGRMTLDLLICGLGLGLVIAPVGAAAINSTSEGDYGIASSLVLVMRLLGMTLGLSALTSWGAGQLDTLVRALPALAQRADESLGAFLTRQTEYQAQQVLVLTLDILHRTFAIAGVLCMLAILPACLLSGRGRREAAHGERTTAEH